MLNLIKPTPKSTQISLICFFTRDWTVDRWLKCLDELEINREITELIFVIDVHNPLLSRKLTDYTLRNSELWGGVKIYQSDQREVNIVRVYGRRDRICEIHRETQYLIRGTQFVFGLEDDTLYPKDSFKKLMNIFESREYVGYASGIQVGRWDTKYIGAWKCDDLENPTQMATIPYVENEIVNVDGGGLYCFLTRTDLYKNANWHWHDECFGPDVCYGIDLRKMGYQCVVDTSLECGHLTEQGVLRPSANCVVARYNKVVQDGVEYWKLKPIQSVKETP